MRKMLRAQATGGWVRLPHGQARKGAGRGPAEGQLLKEEAGAVAWTRHRAWVGVWLCPLFHSGKLPPLFQFLKQGNTSLPTLSWGCREEQMRQTAGRLHRVLVR